MEGYTNVSGNCKDFDNLDIEGRHSSGAGIETPDENIKKEMDDQKRLLELKVALDDGGFGYVFALKIVDHIARWNCHLCQVVIIGQSNVDAHIMSKKHQVKMAVPTHDRTLFTRLEGEGEGDVPTLAPGEPVPPGFEDKLLITRGVAQIQATLDRHKSSPLVGLEYLVELSPAERDNEPMYVCVLCEKRGDPRVAMAHITSYNHQSKYLGINFPKASRAIALALPRSKEGRRGNAEIVSKICSKVEEKHGRLTPLVLDAGVYESKKDFYRAKLERDTHFRESPEENYMEMVNTLTTTYSINLDEVPLPAPQPEKKEDPKRKIAVDRSRIRPHAGKEVDKKDDAKKVSETVHKKTSGSSGKAKKGKPGNSLSSISSVSSSSLSRSPSPVRSRSRSKSKSKSRSKSRSPIERRYPKFANRYRPARRRSRSRGRRSRSRSRRNRSRSRSDSKSRYRNPTFKNKRARDPIAEEKEKWMNFREELDKVEQKLTKSLKYHEKNPEKHPMYPDEWKRFWNKRYKEIQASGQDPSKHDYKPEWIEFWNVRMKEMHQEELQKAKEALRQALNLPREELHQLYQVKRYAKRPPRPPPIEIEDDDIIVISPPTQGGKDVKVNPGRKGKGRKRSPSPWDDEETHKATVRQWTRTKAVYHGDRDRDRVRNHAGYNRAPSKPHYEEDDPIGDPTEPVKVVTVLRLLTAMESQLGSIGPTVNNLLASALAMEKSRPGSSEAILGNPDNLVLFDTVKEKLKGQLFAGIVEQGLLLATRSCIQNLAEVLYRAEKMPQGSVVVTNKAPIVAKVAVMSEPVTVPGVGAMDKVAIAQQIAAALVAQGKTDVTHDELEQLINAVVGMAQASASMDTPITTAAFASMQKPEEEEPPQPPLVLPSPPVVATPPAAPPAEERSPLERLLSVVHSKVPPIVKPTLSAPLFPIVTTPPVPEPPKAPSISSSPPPSKKQKVVPAAQDNKMSASHMEDLNEFDLRELLQNFSHLSTEEQHCLIAYLKKLEAKDPDRVEKLRKFVNLSPNPARAVQKPKPKPIVPAVELHKEPETKDESKTFWKSGRLSPFSMRMSGNGANPLGGANPTHDETFRLKLLEVDDKEKTKEIKLDDSDDDDYSYEDIYAAASKKVTEKEQEEAKAKEREAEEVAKNFDFDIQPFNKLLDQKSSANRDDPSSVLRETKLMIANLMGQLPLKFSQKKASPNPRNINPSTPKNLIPTTPTPTITTPTKPIITTPTEELPKRSKVGTNIDISNNLTEAEAHNSRADARPVPTLVSTNPGPQASPGPATPLPSAYNPNYGATPHYNNQYEQQAFQDGPANERYPEPHQGAYQGGYPGGPEYNGFYPGQPHEQQRQPQEYPQPGGRCYPPQQGYPPQQQGYPPQQGYPQQRPPMQPQYGGGGPPQQQRFPNQYGGPGPGYNQYPHHPQGYY